MSNMNFDQCAVSTITILWTATDLFLLKANKPEPQNPGKYTLIQKITEESNKLVSKLKTVLFTMPIILTSMASNFTAVILTIIHGYFTFYILASFTSSFLPAYFSPFESVELLEKNLGLFDETKDSNDERKKYKYRSFRRAINMSLVSMFCVAHPVKKNSPSLRHYTIGLLPLHFIVNITALLFLYFFTTTDFIVMNGLILNVNYTIFVAFLSSLLNIVLLLFFFYPNILAIFLKFIRNSMKKTNTKDDTYITPISIVFFRWYDA